MSIKFLLDENIPFALIEFLDEKGFMVNHLKKIGKGGIKNGEVYKISEDNESWIITRDSDFENYYNFKHYKVGGIIIIKLSQTKTDFLLDAVNRFLEIHINKLSEKHLIIIEDRKIRIYK